MPDRLRSGHGNQPTPTVREMLRAAGLAAAIAIGVGIVAFSISTLPAIGKMSDESKRALGSAQLAVWCAGYLSFVIAFYRFSPGVRAWFAGLSRARRLSCWLFVATLFAFGVSQLSAGFRGRYLWVRLTEGAFTGTAWTEPLRGWWLRTYDFGDSGMRWMPSLSVGDKYGDDLIKLTLPLWLVGVGVLYPWWGPAIRWLLGGIVRGGHARQSWLFRGMLGGFLISILLFWLSYQAVVLPYALSGYVEAQCGELHWHHHTENVAWPSPTTWSWNGYRGSDTHWQPRLSLGPHVYELALPMWIPTLAFLILLSISVIPRHRHRRRWEGGLCLHCGYDLRGLTDRCTECGTPIERERRTMLSCEDTIRNETAELPGETLSESA